MYRKLLLSRDSPQWPSLQLSEPELLVGHWAVNDMPRFQTIHNACSLYLHNYYYIYLHVNVCWLFPGGRITIDLRALSTSHFDDSLVHCFNRGKRSNLIVQMLQKSHVVTQLKEVSMSNFTDLHIYCTQLNRFAFFMYSSTGRKLNHCQKNNNQYFLYM